VRTKKRLLHWQADKSRPKGGRWKRTYRGKVFYFSGIDGKSDRLGYDRAVEAFTHWKAEVDGEADANKPHRADYERAIKFRMQIVEWCHVESNALADPTIKTTYDRIEKELRRLQSDFAKVRPPALSTADTVQPNAIWVHPLAGVGMTMEEKTKWHKRVVSLLEFQRLGKATAPNQAATVAARIAEYRGRKLAAARSGQIKPGTYKAIADRIPHFERFAGTKDAGKIDEQIVSTFHAAVLKAIGDGEVTQQGGKNRLDAARAFIRWLWQERILETLPRNLDTLTIRVEATEIETFDLDELKTLLEAASERTRLYLLLMLNCGFYQSDIAALRPAEFDAATRHITRKRTKTGHLSENVPMVSWQLWDETYRLLLKFRTSDPQADLLLINENGLSLYRRTIDADGKPHDVDNIKSAFERVCDKLRRQGKLNGKPKSLDKLRKTGSSKLEEHESFGRYSKFFLGQAPQDIAERRYAKPSSDDKFALPLRVEISDQFQIEPQYEGAFCFICPPLHPKCLHLGICRYGPEFVVGERL
jgi:integrase